MQSIVSGLQRSVHGVVRIDARANRVTRASQGMWRMVCGACLVWSASAAIVFGQSSPVSSRGDSEQVDRAEEAAIDPMRWGTLRAKFIYRGELSSHAATRLPTGTVVTDESLVVDRVTRELANVVVYLVVKPGDKPLEIDPRLRTLAKETVTIQLHDDRIVPHVALLQVGQSVRWKNSQSVGEDVLIQSPSEPAQFLMMPGESVVHRFEREARLPLRCGSSVHPWLNGIVVVRSNPYVALTDPRGEVVIAQVPRGKWTFQLWHERLGWISHVRVAGQEKKLSRGMIDVEIDQETRDLGTVEILPAT